MTCHTSILYAQGSFATQDQIIKKVKKGLGRGKMIADIAKD